MLEDLIGPWEALKHTQGTLLEQRKVCALRCAIGLERGDVALIHQQERPKMGITSLSEGRIWVKALFGEAIEEADTAHHSVVLRK